MKTFKTEQEFHDWEAEQERLAEADEGDTPEPATEPEKGEEEQVEAEESKPPAEEAQPPKQDEQPGDKEAAPDADEMSDRERGLLRDLVKARNAKRDLEEQLKTLRGQDQRPAEEVEREFEERFAEDPGKVLREIVESRGGESREAIEARSEMRAVQAFGQEAYEARLEYLHREALADPAFKRDYIDPIVAHHADPNMALMQLAEIRLAESPEYQQWLTDQQIEAKVNARVKELTKGQLKEVLKGGVEPAAIGADGVAGSGRPQRKVSDLSYDERRRLSEAELERAAMED